MKTALLTYTEYTEINMIMSRVKYENDNKTRRVWRIYPTLIKVNQTFDLEGNETGYNLLCKADIEAEHLQDFPELFEGVELIDGHGLTIFDGEAPTDYYTTDDEILNTWIHENSRD